jgi:hypothetical protein
LHPLGALPNEQPYEKIRAYLGDKVVLYFEFVSHLASWLMPISLVGMGLELVVAGSGNFSHPVRTLTRANTYTHNILHYLYSEM